MVIQLPHFVLSYDIHSEILCSLNRTFLHLKCKFNENPIVAKSSFNLSIIWYNWIGMITFAKNEAFALKMSDNRAKN